MGRVVVTWMVGLLLATLVAGCVAEQDTPTVQETNGAGGPTPSNAPPAASTGAPSTTATPSNAPPATSSPPPEETAPTGPELMRRPVEWTIAAGESLAATVPVDVVLIGWDDSVVAELQERFESWGVDQYILRSVLMVDPGTTSADIPGSYREDSPLQWSASIQVHALESPVISLLEDVPEVGPNVFDANAMEAHLAQLLLANGVPIDGPAAPIVVLNAPADERFYQMHYDNGHLPARIWGGTEQMLVMDLGAKQLANDAAYDSPVASDDVDALSLAIDDALAYRILQGPIYEPPLAPCHALTIVHAQQAANRIIDIDGDFLSAARSKAGLETVTREPVYVDLVELSLPEDDPALAALLRGNAYHSAFLDGVRSWVELRWDELHVPHEGCEPYMAFIVYTDYIDYIDGAGSWGIALHDASAGHRFSFSAISYPTRAYLADNDDPTIGGPHFGDLLVVHETGHLLGLPHPHNSLSTQRSSTVWTMSESWTPMSYETGWRALHFGKIDAINWDRNRAGYALLSLPSSDLEALLAGEVGEALGAGDWRSVVEAVQALQFGSAA